MEGLTENQKSCKEFSRLFNKFNLNTIDYEDMILSLLNIPILQSSDIYYKINLNVALGYEKKPNFKNIDTVIEHTFNDPDANKISVGDNIKMESNVNQILKSYQSRNTEANKKKRNYKPDFAK